MGDLHKGAPINAYSGTIETPRIAKTSIAWVEGSRCHDVSFEDGSSVKSTFIYGNNHGHNVILGLQLNYPNGASANIRDGFNSEGKPDKESYAITSKGNSPSAETIRGQALAIMRDWRITDNGMDSGIHSRSLIESSEAFQARMVRNPPSFAATDLSGGQHHQPRLGGGCAPNP